MDSGRDLAGLLAGFAIAVVTTPVGVSGAVFLLPVQLSLLGVPSPQITPTNLLFNVVSGPGGLARYRRRARFDRELLLQLVSGAVPGVMIGAVVRVFLVREPAVFRLLAAAVLGPVGVFILARASRRVPVLERRLHPRTVRTLSFVIGVAGGIYGIGGGSIVGPILVGTGMAVTRVAPAALASTWVTSLVGVGTYAVVSTFTTGPVAPDWTLGVAAGVGGLLGGWVGASLQPRMPDRLLQALLGAAAIALALLYILQAVSASSG